MKVFLLPLLLLSPSSVDATNHNTFADPISQLIIDPTSRFGKIDIGTTTYETSYNVDAYAKVYDSLYDAASSDDCNISNGGTSPKCEAKFAAAYSETIPDTTLSFESMAVSLSPPSVGTAASVWFYSSTSLCAVTLDDEFEDFSFNKANACGFLNNGWLPQSEPTGFAQDKWKLDVDLNTFVTETIKDAFGAACDGNAQTCLGDAMKVSTASMLTVVRYYTEGLASLAAFVCTNQEQLDNVEPLTGSITDVIQASSYLLDVAASLASGNTTSMLFATPAADGSPVVKSWETISLAGYVSDSTDGWNGFVSDPSYIMFSSLSEMKTLILNNKCSFGNPTLEQAIYSPGSSATFDEQPNLDGSSDAAYLISLAEDFGKQVDISNARNVLSFLINPDATLRSALIGLLTTFGNFLSITSYATSQLLTAVSQTNYQEANFPSDSDPSNISDNDKIEMTKIIMKMLIYLKVQICDEEVGTYSDSWTCTKMGYLAEWGGTIDENEESNWFGNVLQDGYNADKSKTGDLTEVYVPMSNVRSHSNSLIDAIMKKSFVKTCDFYHSSNIEFNGAFSQKAKEVASGKPKWRTINGMSVTNTKCALTSDSCTSEAIYFEERSSTPSTNMVDTSAFPAWYASLITSDALPPTIPVNSYVDRTNTFTTATCKARGEALAKLSSYMILNQYVISELNDQLGDCLAGKGPGSSPNFNALDEAVAFALGRSMVADNTGVLLKPSFAASDSNYPFKQGFTGSWCGLQQKYKPRFPAIAPFCNEFLDNANKLKTMVNTDDDYCGLGADASPTSQLLLGEMKDIVNKIESLFAIPMVAGALYYTGQLNTLFASVPTDPALTQEYLAEANAFAKALLSKISQCDNFAAENIAMGLNFEADYDTAKKNYYLAGGQTGIMNSILVSLPCLGIVCSDLFDVSGDTSTMPSYLKAATELCKSTPNSNLPVTLPSSTLGYIVAEQYDVGWVDDVIPEKQVYQRCQMNIDIGKIYDNIMMGDRATAVSIYENGKTSFKSETSLRTLKGLGEKVPTQATTISFNQYITVFGQGWGNEWIDYIWKSKECKTITPSSTELEKQACAAVVTDALIQDVTLPYASYEFGDCVSDCGNGETNNNFGNVKACDEGVCFYAGAEGGWRSGGNFSAYSLAETGFKEFAIIPGSNKVLQLANGMNAMALTDAVSNEGQCVINSNFMKDALGAQKSSEVDDCTLFSDDTARNPKQLNVEERRIQGTLSSVNVQQLLLRLSQLIVAKDQNVDVASLSPITIMAQSSALPVMAKMKSCSPKDGYPKMLNNIIGTLPALVTADSTLSQGTFLTSEEILGGGTVEAMTANFAEIVTSIAENYQCLGFTFCQDLGQLVVPPSSISKEDKFLAVGGALPTYEIIMSTCNSLPSSRSSTDDPVKQHWYFNGVDLTGAFEAPTVMPFIEYKFTTNVYQHLLMDNDISFMANFMTLVKGSNSDLVFPAGFSSARYIYYSGYNSFKSNCDNPQVSMPDDVYLQLKPKCQMIPETEGSETYWNADPLVQNNQMRTLERFNAGYRTDGSFDFEISNNNVKYWGSENWVNEMLMGAWEGTDYKRFTYATSGVSAGARNELIKKVVQYSLLTTYAVREVKATLQDLSCPSTGLSTTPDYGAGMKHFDEAVAFLAGSQMYSADLNAFKNFGNGIYGLMMKRNKYFTNVLLPAYYQLNGLLQTGQYLLGLETQASCDQLDGVFQGIQNAVLIPQVQATTQYLFKNGKNLGGTTVRRLQTTEVMAEEVGELYGFAATVIPQVQNCSSVAGDILFDCINMFKTEVYLPDWKKCVGALESQFTCMGVSCSQVGDLKTGLAVAGTEGDA